MTAEDLKLEDHAVVFEDGLITWIGPTAEVPARCTVIDATGTYVLPGLIDAHVHLFDERQLTLYLANGITSVFNLSGTPFALDWRDRIRAGTMTGPVIFNTGPQVKESALIPVDTEATVPKGAEEVRRFVAMHREMGYDFLKIWSSIAPYRYEAILLECRKQGVRVTGHIPSRVGWRGALAAGQRSIAHVEELVNKWFVRELDEEGLATARAIAEEEELTVITTLITYEMIADTMTDERLAKRMARPINRYLDPMLLELWGSEQNDWWKLRNVSRPEGYYDDALDFMIALTRELHRAGVPILAGSDAGLVLANVVPGWSLHRELEIMERAGMSEYELVRSATARTGEFLDPGSHRGTLVVGAPADLLILRENPFASISNTRSVEAVVAGGVYHGRRELDGFLVDAEEQHDVTRRFMGLLEEHGFDEASRIVARDRAAGRRIPGEASFLVAAYHHASADRIEQAMQMADLACRFYPRSYRPRLFLAGLCALADRREEAREHLRRALELRPDHPLIRRRLEALER